MSRLPGLLLRPDVLQQRFLLRLPRLQLSRAETEREFHINEYQNRRDDGVHSLRDLQQSAVRADVLPTEGTLDQHHQHPDREAVLNERQDVLEDVDDRHDEVRHVSVALPPERHEEERELDQNVDRQGQQRGLEFGDLCGVQNQPADGRA